MDKEISENNIKKGISYTNTECLFALLFYVAGYCYIDMYEGKEALVLAVMTIIIVATELLNQSVRRSFESLVWLGCFVLLCISAAFNLSRVWETDNVMLFIHIFAIWWVLSRSGKMHEGESGHLLPMDALYGGFLIPFTNILLRAHIVYSKLSDSIISAFKRDDKDIEKDKERLAWIAGALVACAILLVMVINLLSMADRNFGECFIKIWKALDAILLKFDIDIVLKLIVSIPVGAYLFGLVGGTHRFSQEKLNISRDNTLSSLESIKRISGKFWTGVICVFSVFYIAFFILQGSYLFGAFVGKLPEGFIVSSYARKGFFELCKVMAVNFALLWMATRMTTKETANARSFKLACALLLCESMLFAIIAFSKLALYISCFGFTPLRLQSTWLVCVLFAACLAWLISLFTGRKVFKLWMYFGAVSLTILSL